MKEGEGEDYYLNESGLMVLTAQFLLQRGYCCGSGCQHCPYEHENVPGKNAKNDIYIFKAKQKNTDAEKK